MSPVLTRMNNPVCLTVAAFSFTIVLKPDLQGGNSVGIGHRRPEMRRNRRENERLTEDEIALHGAVADAVQELVARISVSRNVSYKVSLLKTTPAFSGRKDGQVRDSGCIIGWAW